MSDAAPETGILFARKFQHLTFSLFCFLIPHQDKKLETVWKTKRSSKVSVPHLGKGETLAEKVRKAEATSSISTLNSSENFLLKCQLSAYSQKTFLFQAQRFLPNINLY